MGNTPYLRDILSWKSPNTVCHLTGDIFHTTDFQKISLTKERGDCAEGARLRPMTRETVFLEICNTFLRTEIIS
ncbi:MAG: hypothetical protein B6245_22740 [Desulfobacteraceae bacterium 4572_88]|nr:MAG: hypothetical protein B6245_22740 [Desulfobacteraceae bacterium 4572_88]